MQEKKPTVLCIDDDPDILEQLRIILATKGYAMRSACSAREGLEAIQAETPDCIIVDLMMEDIAAGADFVQSVRASGLNLPIYMLSSVGDSLSQTTDCSQLGLSGVMQKPINADRLYAILRANLDRG